SVRTTDPLPGNQAEQDLDQAFRNTIAKNSQVAGILGGSKAVFGPTGYEGYETMMALKLAMRASGFTGKPDTDKLIAALESLKIPQGPDAPAGELIMNKKDHQGVMSLVVYKVNGQKEQVLQTIPAGQLPPVGNCDVSAAK
ncbi:MAG: ABC transporter substrate-binding protein, partial [Chloroflexota bacterium]|nr:ABC transporter substrate-binding protein [Chloroflexota bacterium]